MGMNRISTYAEDYDSAKDVGAVPTISTTNYRRQRLRKLLSCDRCPPHRRENRHSQIKRKKKQWQLPPARRIDLTDFRNA